MDRKKGQGCRMSPGLISRKTLTQLGRYLATGLLAAALEYGLLILLTEYVGLWYIISNSIAYASGFAVSFLLNRYWSFQSRENIVKQFLQYAALFSLNLILNNVLMYLFTNTAGIPYTISKLIVMSMVVVWNFIIYKKVIYRR